MITRPGSQPGPAWMKKLGDGTVDPRQFRKTMAKIFLFIAVLQGGTILIGDIALSRAHDKHLRSYNSPIRIGGWPLLSVGRTAHGVIAYGGVATGVIAVGGLTAGVIAIGGLSVGVFAFGGLSMGVLALGAVAFGWRAIGGLAVGNAALGGLAIGRYAYGGYGIALGYHEASAKKESLFG